MKKIILVFAAALTMLAGCINNDVTDVNSKSPEFISFTSTTSRASISTIDIMQDDVDGFSVWAVTNGATTWYEDSDSALIDGTNEHVFDDVSQSWNFKTPVLWPTLSSNYPMNFYAVYPNVTTTAMQAAAVITATENPIELGVTFTVPAHTTPSADYNKQIDLLSARATASFKPAGGNLAMTFNHLLSKINIEVAVAESFAAYVEAATIENVGDTREYAGMTDWDTQPTAFGASYTYYGRIYGQGGNSDPNTGHTTEIPRRTFLYGDPRTFYAAAGTPNNSNAHLMLMPQTVATQTWGGGDAPTAAPTTESYICLVYRLMQNGQDLIGRSNASAHPAYAGSSLATDNYTGPLYVKVGYPFSLDWAMGKGYTYRIAFNADGATGGYLLDQNYYDNRGNRTDLIFGDLNGDGNPDGPVVPEPILDGDYIHLIPVISPWDDEGGVEVIE